MLDSDVATGAPSELQHSTLLGHPKGLFVLFLAEACERFSFYGMRALLLLYLLQHFLFSQNESYAIYALYGAMVYFMPIVGGFLADRYLGFQRAVIFGAVLLCVGHGLMAVEGEPASRVAGEVVRNETVITILFLALSFIVMGVGLLKSAISNMVGQLYGPEDNRRDQGFTIFYMGINLGAMVATIVCGYLGTEVGWAYGFGLAGIIMVAGLVVFLLGRPLLEGAGELPRPEIVDEKALGLPKLWWVYIAAVVAVGITTFVFVVPDWARNVLFGLSALAVGSLLVYVGVKHEIQQLIRVLSMLFLMLVAAVFWALFEQFSSSMKVFADRNVDLSVGFFELSAAQIDFLNPLFIIILAPVFAVIWEFLARAKAEPSTPVKFGLGILLAGLAPLALVLGASTVGGDHMVHLGWFVLTFLLFTMGELCLSPVGLSMVTRYSMYEILGIMMGIWFLASSVGTLIAGQLAQLASLDELEAEGVAVASNVSLPVFSDAFFTYGVIGLIVAVVMFVGAPFVRRGLEANAET